MRFFTFFLSFAGLLFSHSLVMAQSPYVSKIWEYQPAPGQYINTLIGGPYAAQSLVGGISGSLSLGAFGGYVVLGFDHRIMNHPDNPYGVDFTVIGNASTLSAEPAAVYVMRDDNSNGLPDDNWYLLAGSDYYFSTSDAAYEITYTFAEAGEDVPWSDNYGNTGYVAQNEYHTQAYYPLADSFPSIPQDEYILSGLKVEARLNSKDEAYITSNPYPFGFADNNPRVLSVSHLIPDNPYTSGLEGGGGDAFDISWAVNENGEAVVLDGIDFIRIQTAVNVSAGWLGELSPEILGVVDVAPDASISGESRRVVLQPLFKTLEPEQSIQVQAFVFEAGKPLYNPVFEFTSADETVASIAADGLLSTHKAGSTWIFATWEGSYRDSLRVEVKHPLGLTETTDQSVLLFPNPAVSQVSVQGDEACRLLSLTDVWGRTYALSPLGRNCWDVSVLSPGIYWLTLLANDQAITLQFIKQ
ncbi:MAG: T9SS type A sorting domain-containing protein [Salinivirgaceae bacterium]